MGFRSSLEKENEYGTLIKSYIRWNELENLASDGVDKIKRVCDEKWHVLKRRILSSYLVSICLIRTKEAAGQLT